MPSDCFNFFVHGHPATAGSKRSFLNPKTGRIVTLDDCKRGKAWRKTVRAAALQWGRKTPMTGALRVDVTFLLRRPKSHFGTGRNVGVLKPSAPLFPTIRPDVLKLARAVEDALTGICWLDDAQIVHEMLAKGFSDDEGVYVTVRAME